MLQRVQTLYLLCAAVLMACAFFMPLATFSGDNQEVVMRSYAFVSPEGESATPWPAILIGITAVLLLANIFTFKRRWLQLRLCFSATVLTLGAQGFVAYYVWHASSNSVVTAAPHVVAWKLGVAAIFPLAAFVFVLLAARGVIKDNRLVRSLDRLR